MTEYFYAAKPRQSEFFGMPRLLFKDSQYKTLPADAKVLYALMLDRIFWHAIPNGWIDEDGRLFLHYRNDDIADMLGCAARRVTRIMAELVAAKLIEVEPHRPNQPRAIYLKRLYWEGV